MSILRLAVRACLLVLVAVDGVAAPDEPAPGSLRELFPPASIRSVERADEALASTSGAKLRVEKQFKLEARDCNDRILVNACIGEARERQRRRLGDIDAVELEANRFKRRDKADRIEAERTKRDSERNANAEADAVQRARNQKAYDEKQGQRTRDAAEQARSAAARSAPIKPRKPMIRTAKPAGAETDEVQHAKQRAKNAADHAVKVREATVHKSDIDRRVAAKTADRKRRDEERLRNEAKAAAKAAASLPKS